MNESGPSVLVVDDDVRVVRSIACLLEETAPVLGHFDKGLVIDVDAIGTIEEVFERAKAGVGSVSG